MLKKQLTSYVELAKALGIDRKRLEDIRQIEGAPKPSAGGVHDLEAWVAFASEHSKKVASNMLPSKRQLEERRLQIQCEKLQFELDIEKKKYIAISQVELEMGQMVGEAKSILRGRLENELPPILEGLSAAQIQVHCKAAIDEVLGRLSK